MACQHLTRLDLLKARGTLRQPREFDIGFQDLVERGAAHEVTMLDRFRADGRSITEISQRPDADADAAQATLEAIRSGTDVIYQGVLLGDRPDGETALLGDRLWGVDGEHGTIDLKVAQAYAGPWPAALVEGKPVLTTAADRLGPRAAWDQFGSAAGVRFPRSVHRCRGRRPRGCGAVPPGR